MPKVNAPTKHYEHWQNCQDTISLNIDMIQAIIGKLGEYANPELVNDLESIVHSLRHAYTENVQSLQHLYKHE